MIRKFLFKLNQNVQFIQRNGQLTRCQLSQNRFVATAPANDTVLQQEHINEAVQLNPLLARVPATQWQLAHETFMNHGLQTSDFLRIVTGNPAVLSRPTRRITEAIEHWRSCQFGEKFMFLLLTKYPEFLDVSDELRLRKQMGYLKSFAGTNKNVWKLLMTCPDLLEQHERNIEEKVQYLKNVMRVEVPEIIKSEALSKSLDEIRCRHVFLERLGLFKPRPLKVDPDEPSKNPRLYQITNTSEKAFATKVCHVSLAEFEAFKELFERELNRPQDAEDDEDEWEDELEYKKR
ncbi:PREDICTED: transcription termination factor 4, mitochondrial [Rhagoletis zephyria]|uniref:transcription termination factor 4, mitochondrial n=1 Tax=Rhagoletis zephyria TaxID=28612 RepID=UPI0008114C97|nr:PREDICTED: transcription termination factor 4, mitochondrial [Rhagoletis zephyria]